MAGFVFIGIILKVETIDKKITQERVVAFFYDLRLFNFAFIPNK